MPRRLLRLSRRRTLILTLLLILTVSMRLPTTPHIFFQDSYVNLWKTGKIASLGYAVDDDAKPWRIDAEKIRNIPAAAAEAASSMKALKNAYPLPPPVLAPLTLAYSTLITGVEPEHAALTYSLLLGLIGCVGAFLLAQELSKDRIICYLTAFFYSTAPVFASETSWAFLARAPVTGPLPSMLLFLLRYRRSGQPANLLIIALLGSFLILAHRIGLVFLAAAASYLLASAAFWIAKKRRRSWKRASTLLPYILTATAASLALLPFYWKTGLLSQALWEYKWGYLAQGADSRIVFFNMLVDYYSSFGILAFFAVIGFIELTLTARKGRFNDMFIASYVLTLSPLTVFGEYTRMLALPAVAYLLAAGLRQSFNLFARFTAPQEAKFLLPAFTILLLTLSVAFSLLMVGHWKETTKVPYLPVSQWVDCRIVAAADYAGSLQGGVLASPYFISWSTYIAPYLSEDDKIAYLYDFVSVNPPEDVDVFMALRNVTHVLESRETMKSWSYPIAFPSDAELMRRVHETQDHLFSSGLVDVWEAYDVPAFTSHGDLTDAFSGPETVVGLADGRLYVLTSDGRVIVPLKRSLGAGITAVSAGDFTPRGLDDLVIGLSNGLVILLDNSGRVVWNYSLENDTLSHLSPINLTGLAQSGILVETSSGRRLALNSSGGLAYIL